MPVQLVVVTGTRPDLHVVVRRAADLLHDFLDDSPVGSASPCAVALNIDHIYLALAWPEFVIGVDPGPASRIPAIPPNGYSPAWAEKVLLMRLAASRNLWIGDHGHVFSFRTRMPGVGDARADIEACTQWLMTLPPVHQVVLGHMKRFLAKTTAECVLVSGGPPALTAELRAWPATRTLAVSDDQSLVASAYGLYDRLKAHVPA